MLRSVCGAYKYLFHTQNSSGHISSKIVPCGRSVVAPFSCMFENIEIDKMVFTLIFNIKHNVQTKIRITQVKILIVFL